MASVINFAPLTFADMCKRMEDYLSACLLALWVIINRAKDSKLTYSADIGKCHGGLVKHAFISLSQADLKRGGPTSYY